jgi:predicted transcriptional regulator
MKGIVSIYMSISIELPDEIAKAVEQLSRASGRPPEQIVIDALSAHFPPISQDLRDEFEAWEKASEEDAAKLDGENTGP